MSMVQVFSDPKHFDCTKEPAMMWSKNVRGLLAAAALTNYAPNLRAQETTTYTYDAKGRLQQVQRNGGPVSGTTTSYAYDAADNRSNVTVANSPNGTAGDDSGSQAATRAFHYIVVPLNGYTLIKIPG